MTAFVVLEVAVVALVFGAVALCGIGWWMSLTDWRNQRRRERGQPELRAFTHQEDL